MAETLLGFDKSNKGLPDTSDSVGSLFNRKIEFHLARKPFTSFSNDNGSGFKLETLNPTRLDPYRFDGSNQGSSYSCLAGKKPDPSEFLDFGFDPELKFGITFRRIGAGLENLGNTCFLNSVLQCLTYTEPLAAYLQSGKHQNSCRTAGFCALCAIQKHVSRALQLPGRSLAPKDLVSNLRCISRSFRNARQEDAHEYMVNLLESMHKCCLPVGVPSESPSAYDKSLVHKIFGGRLRSQVKCMQCYFCSDKFDPFLDLSLEIIKAESLNRALTHFTAKEYLDGGERQYQCQKCKHKVKALKQLSIHQVPYVLTIHLKRFGAYQPGQKIDKKIQFGPTLDLKPFVTGPYDGDLKYTLYGVLVHAGWSTHSGHYYCYVRTSSGMWYSLDDLQVRQVSEKVVLDQKAYMLFYVRDITNSAIKKHVQKESVIGKIYHSNSNQGLKETVPVHKGINGMEFSASVTNNAAVDRLLPFPHPDEEEQFTPSAACIKCSDNSVNNALGATIDGNCNKERRTEEDNTDLVTKKYQSNVNANALKDDDIKKHPSVSVAITDELNGNHNSAGDPCMAEKGSKKMRSEALLHDPDERESACIDHVRSLDKSSWENSLANGLLRENTLGDGCQRKRELSGVQTTPINGAVDRKEQQKLKKKLSKCQINNVHIGSSVLFRAYLSLRKKKFKRRIVKISNRIQEHLMDTECSPSTSEYVHSQGKGFKSSSSKKTNIAFANNFESSSCNLAMGIVDEEFSERIDQNGGRGTNLSKEISRDSFQNGLMNMLTRGLEEKTAARWDGIDFAPFPIKELSVVESARVGYIGDEWDEEYDRGKRKKVRISQNVFDGSNPFQEIASKKAKLKKMKSSSGDRPFRI